MSSQLPASDYSARPEWNPNGIRIERLTNEGAQAEGLPMGVGYIRVTISDDRTEQSAILPAGEARKVAEGILHLCRMKNI